MREIVDYCIVTRSGPIGDREIKRNFEIEVRTKLQEGYELYGGHKIHITKVNNIIYSQTVIQYAKT